MSLGNEHCGQKGDGNEKNVFIECLGLDPAIDGILQKNGLGNISSLRKAVRDRTLRCVPGIGPKRAKEVELAVHAFDSGEHDGERDDKKPRGGNRGKEVYIPNKREIREGCEKVRRKRKEGESERSKRKRQQGNWTLPVISMHDFMCIENDLASEDY